MATSGFEDATVVFDLDGTLVDTAPDIRRALNAVLTAEGLPEASLDDVRRDVGGGVRMLIERSLSRHGATRPDPEIADLTDRYVEAYAADIAAMSKPFDGVESALDVLAAAGARLCVCTNKQTGLSIQLLKALGLSHRFAAIVGADSVANRKPHADHLLAAVAAAGGVAGRALMVGDSAADVGAARAAGAPVLLYAFGYTDTAPELLSADAVFTHYLDLPGLVARHLSGR
jgi:phosphoglycolate phosphatase